ncbi:MAG: acyl carrier protein [Bacteroidetes bacterium]|nr:acyl carrier protein [Bacteroidota bacterium]MBL0258568.1 acyl carrier protein [Bacteroidota bacterium]MBP6402256.1 acyl carrier protein [Bacteroidia bacterium]
MDKNEILNQLTIIFKKIFENDAVILQMDTTANDVDGWDSLTHTSMIVEVEKHFNVKFKLKEVLSFKNVGDMVNMIHSKLHSV